MTNPPTLSKEDRRRIDMSRKLAAQYNLEVCYDSTIGVYLKAKRDYNVGDLVLREREEFVCDLQQWDTIDDDKIPSLFPKYQQLSHSQLMKVPYLKNEVKSLVRDSSLSYDQAVQFIALLMLNAVGCDCCGLKLFPLISKMMHSCSPNCFLIDKKDDEAVRIIATKPIKNGDIITRSYITNDDLFWGSGVRKEYIEKFMHFTCFCERCIMVDYFDCFLCDECSGDICFFQFNHHDDVVDILNEYKCIGCNALYEEENLPLDLSFELENIAFQVKAKYEKQIYCNKAENGQLLTELIIKSTRRLGPRHWCTIIFMEAYIFHYFHHFRKPIPVVVKFVLLLLEFYATVLYKVCPMAASSRMDELLEWYAVPSKHINTLFPYYKLSEDCKNMDRWKKLTTHYE